jgi:hemolysin III
MADGPISAGLVIPGDDLAERPAKPRLRGVSHEVAAFVFPLMGLVAVLVAGPLSDKVAVAVYALGVSGMYLVSACYHRAKWAPLPKSRMRRLDHSMILVAIASTYTPVAVIALPVGTTVPLLAVDWGLAVAGVLVCNLWLSAPQWVMGAFYICTGWAALAVLPALMAGLGTFTFALLLAGGLVYTMGAVTLYSRRPDPAPAVFGYHEVFHALVLLAGLLFYVVVVQVAARG